MLKRIKGLKNRCYITIDRISSFAERVEISGQSFGECAGDERLQQKQLVAFNQLDRLNRIERSIK